MATFEEYYKNFIKEYRDRDWKMSFFFTHYNESNGTCCLNNIMNNYNTYISDGKTRNDIL